MSPFSVPVFSPLITNPSHLVESQVGVGLVGETGPHNLERHASFRLLEPTGLFQPTHPSHPGITHLFLSTYKICLSLPCQKQNIIDVLCFHPTPSSSTFLPISAKLPRRVCIQSLLPSSPFQPILSSIFCLKRPSISNPYLSNVVASFPFYFYLVFLQYLMHFWKLPLFLLFFLPAVPSSTLALSFDGTYSAYP